MGLEHAARASSLPEFSRLLERPVSPKFTESQMEMQAYEATMRAIFCRSIIFLEYVMK